MGNTPISISTFTNDSGCLESWITFKTGRGNRKEKKKKKNEGKKRRRYYIGPPAGVLLTVDDVNWSC